MTDETQQGTCWWFNCPESATTYVTAGGVTRFYCPKHAEHVERYYAKAARAEEKAAHRND